MPYYNGGNIATPPYTQDEAATVIQRLFEYLRIGDTVSAGGLFLYSGGGLQVMADEMLGAFGDGFFQHLEQRTFGTTLIGEDAAQVRLSMTHIDLWEYPFEEGNPPLVEIDLTVDLTLHEGQWMIVDHDDKLMFALLGMAVIE